MTDAAAPPAAIGIARLDEEQADFLALLAYLHLRHGKERQALALIESGRLFNGDHPALLKLAAAAHLANGQPELALEAVERFLALDGDTAAGKPIHLLRAQALWRLHRPEEARAAMLRYHSPASDDTP